MQGTYISRHAHENRAHLAELSSPKVYKQKGGSGRGSNLI